MMTGIYRESETVRTASTASCKKHAAGRRPQVECVMLSGHWAMVLRWQHTFAVPKYHPHRMAAEGVPWANRLLPTSCALDYCKCHLGSGTLEKRVDNLVVGCSLVPREFQRDQRPPGPVRTRTMECFRCFILNTELFFRALQTPQNTHNLYRFLNKRLVNILSIARYDESIARIRPSWVDLQWITIIKSP